MIIDDSNPCGNTSLILDSVCLNKLNAFQSVEDPRQYRPNSREWKWIIYTVNFDYDTTDSKIESPTLLVGFVKGHHYVYQNNNLIHQVHTTRSYSIAPLISSDLRAHNSVTIAVQYSTEQYPGLYSSYAPTIGNYDSILNLSRKNFEFVDVRPWFFILTKFFVILTSLTLYVFSQKRPELLILGIFVLSTLFINIEQLESVRASMPSLLRFKCLYLSFIIPQIILGFFVLTYFRYPKNRAIQFLILSGALSFFQIQGIVFGQDESHLISHLENWSKSPFLFLSVGYLILSIFSVLDIKNRFKINHRVRLGFLFSGSLSLTSILAYHQLKIQWADPSSSSTLNLIPYEGLIDLGIIAFMAIIPFTEIIISEWRRFDIEKKTQTIINLILKGVHGNLHPYLEMMIEKTCRILQARKGSVLLKNYSDGGFTFVTAFGPNAKQVVGNSPNEGDFSYNFLKQSEPKAMAVPNLKYAPLDSKLFKPTQHSSPSFMAVPLMHDNELFGAIFVSDPEPGRNWYNHLDLYALEIIGPKISDEVYKAYQHETLKKERAELRLVVEESNATMKAMAASFEEHYHQEDDDTIGHTASVTTLSTSILHALIELDLVKDLKLGDYEKNIDLRSISVEQRLLRLGFGHDVGKRDVPVHILRKPGGLSFPEEVHQMWGHALASYYILTGKFQKALFNRTKVLEEIQIELHGKTSPNVVNYLKPHVGTRERLQAVKPNFDELIAKGKMAEFDAIQACAHQEYYNGQGYPFALKEEEIPILARILCVADAVAVMKLRSFYDKKKTWEWVYFEIEACSGTQFDPVIVKAAQHFILHHTPINRKIIDEVRSRGLTGKDARDCPLVIKEVDVSPGKKGAA